MLKIRITLLLVLFMVGQFSRASVAPFYLDENTHQNSDLRFIEHIGPGPLDNYLAMNVQFTPIADLFRQLLLQERRPLTNRGEAHITVITPIEYNEVLKKYLSIEEINSIARQEQIQQSQFKIECLGVGAIKNGEQIDKTFYIVTPSADLLRIRKKIREAYQKNALIKGMMVSDFNAEAYYPHITVGYTQRDLHESDGVIKNSDSCEYGITEISPALQ